MQTFFSPIPTILFFLNHTLQCLIAMNKSDLQIIDYSLFIALKPVVGHTSNKDILS
jgi:hypothetical protein